MLKLIYLAHRKPGFTPDEFVCRWRRHGALGMSQPLWRFARGYVQCEPIRPAPLAGASQDYDAIACYMVDDAMLTGMTDDDMPGAIAMAEDELETFSRPIPEDCLWVEAEAIKPGILGGITAFLFFKDSAAARACAEACADKDSLDRVILNTADSGARGLQANTLPYGAVLELSARHVPALQAGVEDGDNSVLAQADLAVVTREAVLWDRMDAAS
jgi:hypothetical protein